ncbi:protease inhibitor Inh [Microvirga subterranea]|uniref:Protease inhibitor Inh n=2 Tax=Microvirga subterranea TaxID=186651 RepID=A0A370HD26_9HYPH|nr:protease inhibitor Inh [Microvirga subterranea]
MAKPPVQAHAASVIYAVLRKSTSLVRLSCPVVFLLALSACNGTGTVYDRGPWSHVPKTEPLPQLYTGPWRAPPVEAIEEIGHPIASGHARSASSIEPMEPIGRWASRSRTELSEDIAPPFHDAPVVGEPPLTSPIPEPSQVISKDGPAPQAPLPQTRRRTALTGNWSADEGNGRRCRVQLSSVPSLDLYKASSAQCASKALQEINAWSMVDGDIVLYSRGRVVSRLKGEDTAYSGALNGSGGSITLTR